MKIHDALIYELIKPEKLGKPTGDIIKIIGSGKIEYKLEETLRLQIRAKSLVPSRIIDPSEIIIEEMTPDIIVTRLEPISGQSNKVAIEVETDVDFDFGLSLRQIKKYLKITPDVRVIIPRENKSFAPLYKNEGFRAYLWDAIRIWQCLRCKNQSEVEGPFEPYCMKCKGNTRHRLIGLKNTKFEEFS